MVRTSSGTRYFLSADRSIIAQARKLAAQDMAAAKPRSTITLTRQRQEVDKKKAEEVLKKARPQATISLFGLFGGDSPTPAPKIPPPSAASTKNQPRRKKKAPRGVPTISRWRKNRDGSVTGFITGSPSFSEGERITTSPITGGSPAAGEVVKTGSGSRYFLNY